MMAVFRAEGTWPDWRERFMILVIRGLMAQMFDLTRAVGTGSRAQVEDFIVLMVTSTSRCVMLEKQQIGWEIPGCGMAVGAGGVEGLVRWDRMVSTLVLKKVMKLLHCSSVISVCVGVCGLRSWFMVENNCLELPGLLLIMLE